MKTLLLIIAFGSIVSALRCPSQWSMYKSNCYRYFSQPKPFWDALNFCRKQLFFAKNSTTERRYSDLVSIHDPSENSFVSSLGPVGINFFIGLYHNINEDRRTWHWTDKTLVDYTNWAPGQPDYSHQNFGVMWNRNVPSRWDDADWRNGLPFVCKVKADDCLRLSDEGPETVCRNHLGVEDGTTSLTSSSKWDAQHGPSRGRLNTRPSNGLIGAWAAKSNNQNQWIQADIGALKDVTGIITQGRNGCCDQWVTSYEVLYSIDGNNFDAVIGSNKETAVFVGNRDRDTQVTNLFLTPVHARYIRIHPLTWNNHISLRFEVLGCQDDASVAGEICENGGIFKNRRCVCQEPYECIDCSWYNGCSSNPCQNGGRCINHDHRYSCECDEGLTGEHCEKYEGCPCLNNGTCTKDHENALHICVCPEDYTGVTCQTYIGHCKENPCENGGSCHSILASPFYICQCKSPYIGSRCTTTIYDCISNPCLNNGTCIPNAENEGASCLCHSDYTGSTCGFLKQTSSAVYSDTSNAGLKTAFIMVTAVMSIAIILLISYVYSIKRRREMPEDVAFVGFDNVG